MRDRDDGALVALEEALQPGDGLGIEVVRRLVEEEQVRRREEQPAERDAASLAARKGRHVLLTRWAAERIHRRVEHLVEAPGVMAVDLVLHAGLLLEERVEVSVRLGELRGDLIEAVEQVPQRADAVLDVPAHVPGGIELGLLGEQADSRARRELGDAARGLLEARP